MATDRGEYGLQRYMFAIGNCAGKVDASRTMAVVSRPRPALRPLRSPRLAFGGTLPATVLVLPVTAGRTPEVGEHRRVICHQGAEMSSVYDNLLDLDPY
jgi:hypothetical protein